MKQAALLGMPNCGKSSIYRLLTGHRAATGNRAGVTVTADTASVFGSGERILLTDLPGIRSVHPTSEDEAVTLRFLDTRSPDLLIAVLDATDAVRQLPPVCKLLQRAHARSVLMVFNFCDELERFPDAEAMTCLMKLPVLAVSARTGQGIPELTATVRAMAGAEGTGKKNFNFIAKQRYRDAAKPICCPGGMIPDRDGDFGDRKSDDSRAFSGRCHASGDRKVFCHTGSGRDGAVLRRKKTDVDHPTSRFPKADEKTAKSHLTSGLCKTFGGNSGSWICPNDGHSDAHERHASIASRSLSANPVNAAYRNSEYGYCRLPDANAGKCNICTDGSHEKLRDARSVPFEIPVSSGTSGCAKNGYGRSIGHGYQGQNTADSANKPPMTFGTDSNCGTGVWIDDAQMMAVVSLLGKVSVKKQRRSNRLDCLFLSPVYGFPLFFLMMGFLLWMTFGFPGKVLTEGFCELMLSPLSELLLRLCAGAPGWLMSLLRYGVLGGVGAVLSFLPRLALLFLFQSVLEQCGLLARVNRLFDPVFLKFGLRGDAVTPLLLGFGCSVPAVLCTRAMKDCAARERCACFLPTVACSARMPLCLLIADCCFPAAGWAVCALVWLFSGVCFLFFCALSARWEKKAMAPVQHTDPLPRWRMPDWRELTGAVWSHVLHFLSRAGGMIFLFSVLVWLLSGFRPGVSGSVPVEESLLAMIGAWLAPVLSPLGLGDWRIASALLAGVGAKEAALSTLGVLLGGNGDLPAALSASGLLTPASAVSLLIFYTLYFPCISTVSALRRREKRYIWLPLLSAYLLAAAVYQISRLL